MAGFCDGGSEPVGSLKAICNRFRRLQSDASMQLTREQIAARRQTQILASHSNEDRACVFKHMANRTPLLYFQANALIVPLESPAMDGDPSLNPFISVFVSEHRKDALDYIGNHTPALTFIPFVTSDLILEPLCDVRKKLWNDDELELG
ncbi:hypothetical protein ANN_17131 [Periplaneta americana]|uniref:Uncharacterized protein n=1 Tax=Periplaneta americana TaxID=6978 RepID=A0ABQ8ST46_PERAM|nr:hypothetical protein ANN_17131 [Periplaneta americana]